MQNTATILLQLAVASNEYCFMDSLLEAHSLC